MPISFNKNIKIVITSLPYLLRTKLINYVN
jgi:hypothetical protein